MHRVLLTALAFSVLTLPAARAWDALGHMIVCQIAYDNLPPATKAKFDELLAQFNREKQTEYTPAISGTYMDDIRDQTRDYNKWHYINLPFTPDGLPLPSASEENVLWAIKKCLAILDGEATDPNIDRAQAMVMLNHLVGDVHQPLHTTSNDDYGGNKVIVPNLTDAQLAVFKSKGNLHWFWDMGYRVSIDGDGKVASAFTAPFYSRSAPVAGHLKAVDLVRDKAREFEKKYPAATLGEPATPEEWISESHELGFDYGYGKLPGGPNANPANLDETYVDGAREICEKRITLAGYRLADLLTKHLK